MLELPSHGPAARTPAAGAARRRSGHGTETVVWHDRHCRSSIGGCFPSRWIEWNLVSACRHVPGLLTDPSACPAWFSPRTCRRPTRFHSSIGRSDSRIRAIGGHVLCRVWALGFGGFGASGLRFAVFSDKLRGSQAPSSSPVRTSAFHAGNTGSNPVGVTRWVADNAPLLPNTWVVSWGIVSVAVRNAARRSANRRSCYRWCRGRESNPHTLAGARPST